MRARQPAAGVEPRLERQRHLEQPFGSARQIRPRLAQDVDVVPCPPQRSSQVRARMLQTRFLIADAQSRKVLSPIKMAILPKRGLRKLLVDEVHKFVGISPYRIE